MNDTTRMFPRSIEEIKRTNPEWQGLNASEANPFKGPYTEHGPSWRFTWPYTVAVFFVIFLAYLFLIFYFHVKSAAAEGMRERSRAENLEKRMQALCGSNSVVSPIGNGVWQCQDKHGRKTITVQE